MEDLKMNRNSQWLFEAPILTQFSRHRLGEFETVSPTSQEEEKCKLSWDKLLGSLPEDVRNALNNEDWNNAVVLTIHHGIRDLTTLTRIIFYAKYGKNRGYCKLKNNQADAKYKQYWNQDKSSIRGIMARPSPPLAQKGGIVCRKVERKLADSKPDNPPIDITGRYENQFKFNGKSLTDWTVSINQAGRHIEGIITKILYPDPRPRGWLFHQDDNPKDRPFTEIYGDLQSDGSFLFFDRRNPSGNWGYFRFENGFLHWELSGGSKSRLVAIAKTPTLMNTAPFTKEVWLHEKFPLTKAQIEHLVNQLAEDKISRYLQAYFTTPADITIAAKKAMVDKAALLNRYIADVITNKFAGTHDQDRDLAKFYCKVILTNNKWKFKQITRSQLDWIQIMLDVNTGNGFRLPAIEKYLGLRASKNIADPQTPPHRYKVSILVKGVGFIGAYYRGNLTVEKLDTPTWKETFKVTLKGFQAIPGYKIEQTGEAETYHEWTRQDFIGSIHLVMGEGGAKVPGVNISGSAGFMHIFGLEYLPPMDVLWAEKSVKLNPSKKFKITKPDLKGLWGQIYHKNLPDVDLSKVVNTDYTADYKLQNDVHFCLGSALLTEDARQALRIVCANELVAFLSPKSVLEVIGHTDTVDTPDRNKRTTSKLQFNMTLSLLRAENTMKAIKDILGSNFQIPNAQIKPSGWGENLAIKDGRPDNKPDPKYRRVDVFLNSRLVISLKAQ
jgi:outer membrane protein OmpA-like peptidoglycan-associated protein